jgi:enoyl-CoA hydratase/carnithine racemase
MAINIGGVTMPSEETRTLEEMMTYEKDRKNKIAYITFNRPEILNAASGPMRRRYADLLWQANVDNDVKVLVIRGAGDNLGSGADLPDDFKNWDEHPLREVGVDPNADVTVPPEGTYRYRYNLNQTFASVRGGCRSLQEFKKISIVEAKGYCYGWHFYQCADADLVISSDDALFGHSAFRYSGWGPRMWTWMERIGLRKFQEMIHTGRPFTAAEMDKCGFINSVVPRDKLEAEVNKYAMACVNNGPTDRIVVQKSLFEIYKQYRGEYMGSVLTALVESIGSQLKGEDGELMITEGKLIPAGLAAGVKEAEKRFPPEWRQSKGGRSRP